MEILSLPILIAVIVVVWVFRRSLKTVGSMAENALEVSAKEVHASNVHRLASISLSDETVTKAKENQAKLDSIII